MSLRADEFVAAVKEALGAKNANELADRLGLGAAGGQRVGRWLTGKNEPDYAATMLMLEKAGWLSTDVGSALAAGEVPRDPLTALVTTVAEIADGQARIADHLGVALDDPGPTEADPSPEKVASKRKRA